VGWLDRNRNAVFSALIVVIAVGGAVLFLQRRGGPQPLEIRFDGSSTAQIKVQVDGAVQNPGVYPLSEDSRVEDALAAAGGATDDADLQALNLAQRLDDEDKLVVPHRGETVNAVTNASDMIDINSASAAELDSLPGIGEAYAGRIVESRQSMGRFSTIDELATRQVIPNSTYEKIKNLITAGP